MLGCCDVHQIPPQRFASKWGQFRLAYPDELGWGPAHGQTGSYLLLRPAKSPSPTIGERLRAHAESWGWVVGEPTEEMPFGLPGGRLVVSRGEIEFEATWFGTRTIEDAEEKLLKAMREQDEAATGS